MDAADSGRSRETIRPVECRCSSGREGLVRKVVQRVVVHPDRIEIEVGKQKLSDILTADLHASSVPAATHQPEQGSSDVIRFNIETRVKRCGGEMRLVFPPDHPG